MALDKTRVVVALSGGVDSSVAAYLLSKKGYDVIGVFMKNWHDESVTISKECPWLEDSYDAMIISEKLSIPFQTVDLSIDYQKKIVDYMFNEYEKGNTPNPDVLCNREIKFDIFLKIAMKFSNRLRSNHRSLKWVGQRRRGPIGLVCRNCPFRDRGPYHFQLHGCV